MSENRKPDQFNPEKVSEDEIYKFLTTHWHHQNQLSWNRLVVILALESGTLAGSYQTRGWIGCALLLIGTYVGYVLYRLIRRDWAVRDQQKPLDILDSVHKPLGFRMIPEGTLWNNGQFLLSRLFVALLATNFLAFIIFLPCIPFLHFR